MIRSAIASIAALLPATAIAQDGPSFDCAQAGSSAEELICSDTELAAIDRRLAARWSDSLEVVRGLEAGAEDAESELRAYQRGWIKGRDECWKATDPRVCVRESYLRREAELVAKWLLEEPSGTAFWSCDGNPSNEVVTMFFDTELPSVRFERGDSIDVGTLVPTASGARYEGSFGRSIWVKGSEALYREPDPDGSSHDCVLASES